MLIEVTSDVLIEPTEVVSIERLKKCSSTPSGGYQYDWEDGSIIVLKNGRKIWIEGRTPSELRGLLFPPGLKRPQGPQK